MLTGSFFALIFHWGVDEADHSPGMTRGYIADLYLIVLGSVGTTREI